MVPDDEHLDVVVDRIVWSPANRQRVLDSLEQALHFGKGRLTVTIPPDENHPYSAARDCSFCDVSYPAPSPHLFSFNSPLGACESCRGFGRIIDVDLDLVIPDKTLSLEEGAIKPWSIHNADGIL